MTRRDHDSPHSHGRKDLLQAIADKADVTLSDVVVRAVRDFIEANPVQAKAKKK